MQVWKCGRIAGSLCRVPCLWLIMGSVRARVLSVLRARPPGTLCSFMLHWGARQCRHWCRDCPQQASYTAGPFIDNMQRGTLRLCARQVASPHSARKVVVVVIEIVIDGIVIIIVGGDSSIFFGSGIDLEMPVDLSLIHI